MTNGRRGPAERTKADNALTPAQARYVAVRLTARSMTEAATAVGVTERTARRWEAMPHVAAALRVQRDAALDEATMAAATVVRDAFWSLADIARDKTMPPATRVAAWRVILDSALRFREQVELAARLAELEGRLSNA